MGAKGGRTTQQATTGVDTPTAVVVKAWRDTAVDTKQAGQGRDKQRGCRTSRPGKGREGDAGQGCKGGQRPRSPRQACELIEAAKCGGCIS